MYFGDFWRSEPKNNIISTELSFLCEIMSIYDFYSDIWSVLSYKFSSCTLKSFPFNCKSFDVKVAKIYYLQTSSFIRETFLFIHEAN